MLRTIERYAHIISKYRIIKFEQFGENLRFIAEFELKNNTILYAREIIIEGKKRKYSFHWQNLDGERIIRWDNAPDWDVETFPHHKHVGDDVQPSYERTLDQVFNYIARSISQ